MAETAKILNPKKKVLQPDIEAGCSLADGITAADVRQLRAKHPNAAIVCYVNTTAEVKAECDVCCTSANATKILRALPEKEIVLVPDKYMAVNLQKLIAEKKIHGWDALCIVHKEFSGEKLKAFRKQYPDLQILVHTECAPDVVANADLAGGTGDMVKFVKNSPAKRFMLVTECGLNDRMKVEFPDKEFIGMCGLCPYMKKINLKNVLQVMKEPRKEQVIEIPEEIRKKAEKCLLKMFEYG